MNIVKLQNQLKSVPVETLIQYVQGANPEVPSYLALAEIKNRKDMETRYASQNEKAPSSSVAEDLTQAPQSSGLAMLAKNPTPQGAPSSQGVADLPVPDNMYNEQNFAAGGIVAFSGQDGVSDVASKKYAAWQESAWPGLSPSYWLAGAQDIMSKYSWVRDPATGKLIREKDLTTPNPRMTDWERARELRKQGYLAEADTLEKAAMSPKVDTKGLAGLNTSSAGAEPGMTFSRDELANIYQNTTPTRTKPVVNPNAPAAEAAPANVDVTKPATLGTPGIDSLLEDTTGLAEKKMARYEQMMGTNPERARLEELVKKYETGAGEQERMAPWMALAKAGFTMAGGKSPYAIQNLSEGAVAGLSDYAQAKDRLDKLNERQIDLRSKLLQVDDARKSAAVTYGVNSEEHAAARNAQVKLKDLEEQNANLRADAQNKTHIKAAQIAAAKKSDYETYLDLAKQDDDNYKTVKDKDGNVKKVFDSGKVTQVYKSFGGSSGLDDDKLLEMWKQEKLLDKNFKMPFQDYVTMMRTKSNGAGSAGTSSAGWSNFKVK